MILWDIETGTATLDFTQASVDFVYNVKLQGDRLAVANKDTGEALRIYDVRTGKKAIVFNPKGQQLRCMDYVGDRVMAGTFESKILGNTALSNKSAASPPYGLQIGT